ncbi:hypothetical protein AB7783_26635 [Tardiphaga sp. 172_B4_N1_3]|uniref:hypothetical protein n=1 Tax=Tardiphaga sp. 172_B4_N1_3 TaxID=3240787 RepID=UPI003F8BF28E
MGSSDPIYSVRQLADDQFAIEAKWSTGKTKLLTGYFACHAAASRFASRLHVKPSASAREEVAETASDSGYTVDFLAFKHGLALEQASQLIREVGNSRKTLDAAVTALQQNRARALQP